MVADHNVRTYDEEVRGRVPAAIKRIVPAEAAVSGAPRGPEITPLFRTGFRKPNQRLRARISEVRHVPSVFWPFAASIATTTRPHERHSRQTQSAFCPLARFRPARTATACRLAGLPLGQPAASTDKEGRPMNTVVALFPGWIGPLRFGLILVTARASCDFTR